MDPILICTIDSKILDVELQRSTTTSTLPPSTGTPPSIPGCVDCFVVLNDDQQAAFILNLIQTTTNPETGQGPFVGVTTPEDLCIVLISLTESEGAIDDALIEVESALSSPEVGISSDVVSQIMECVKQVLGIST